MDDRSKHVAALRCDVMISGSRQAANATRFGEIPQRRFDNLTFGDARKGTYTRT
jgi:hypothetical protein